MEQRRIVLTVVRTGPLASIRGGLGGVGDARVPVEGAIASMIGEVLRAVDGLSAVDREFLEGLASHKMPPLVDPWDLAQVLYSALCLVAQAPVCVHESASGFFASTAELEDLFEKTHVRRGMPALEVEDLVPAYGERSHVVIKPGSIAALHRSLAATGLVRPPEDRAPAWRMSRGAFESVLHLAESQGLGLLVYER